MKNIIVIIILVLLLFIGFYTFREPVIAFFYQPTATVVEKGWVIENGLSASNTNGNMIAVNLEVPWEMVFLPDGDILVTERPGNLKRFGKTQKTITIPGVYATAEGGLLGMALDPDFAQNRYLYLYVTTKHNGNTVNEVRRYVYTKAGDLQQETTLLSGIPGAQTHNGGRIAFGPDGCLYITTGDAANPTLAQVKHSLAGKILRISRDGKPAPGNPFNDAVYSYGHRNPQGLAWDAQRRLWSTEHGPVAHDELNRIEAGQNYGWPIVKGMETAPGIQVPILDSGSHETWAPTGAAYLNGSIYFGGLRGQTLYEVKIDPETGDVTRFMGHFRMEFGRIRNVVAGPDDALYIMTSNRDGRGRPRPDDDIIVRLAPPILPEFPPVEQAEPPVEAP